MLRRLLAGLLLLVVASGPSAEPPRPKDTVAQLVPKLSDKEPFIHLAAARDLGDLGVAARAAIPALAAAMRDGSPNLRTAAGKALAQIGSAAVPELSKTLQEPDARLRHTAARALSRIGPPARDAVPALTLALRDRSVGVRANAVLALGEVGPEARSSVPDLVRLLGDGNEMVRTLALEALRSIGKDATATVKKALGEGQGESRLYVAKALGLLGSQAKEAVPDLGMALQDEDARVRAAAAEALGRMGLEAKDAVPELLDALQDKDLRTQMNVAATLTDLAAAGVPGLLEKIREADRKGGWARPLVQARFGAARPEMVAQLRKDLDDKDPLVRMKAALALGELAPQSQAAADAMKKALRDADPKVRLAAVEGLQREITAMGEALKAEEKAQRKLRRPALLKAMNDPAVQAPLDRFLTLYIAVKGKHSQLQSKGIGNLMAAGFGLGSLDATVDNLGPEAIPALVRALNLAAAYKVGFC
jgi:HEAT repeat protein